MANAGPWCNCLPHMKLCNAEIFANCAFCLRVVCGKHLTKCYCEIRISRENRLRRYREEMSEKLASNSEILRGVPGSSGSSKDNLFRSPTWVKSLRSVVCLILKNGTLLLN